MKNFIYGTVLTKTSKLKTVKNFRTHTHANSQKLKTAKSPSTYTYEYKKVKAAKHFSVFMQTH